MLALPLVVCLEDQLSISNNANAVMSFMGNIIMSIGPPLQILIDSGVLPRPHQYLTGQIGNHVFWEKACSLISGLMCCGQHIIQLVLDADLIQPLVHMLAADAHHTKNEAVCVLANAARRGSFEQINIMVDQGCLEPICMSIKSHEERSQNLCIEGLWNILRMGEANNANGANPYIGMVEALGGFIGLQGLQNDAQVGDRVIMMLRRYNFH